MLKTVAPYTARQFARAIVMPNLAPPITAVESAAAYRDRILAATGAGFTPLMTCYLTDATDPDEVARGFAEGVWIAAKLYPAGATTNSASGVTDIGNISSVLARMEKIGMVLCVHGEVTDPAIDVFDREAMFIERVLTGVVRDFPGLKNRVRTYHHRRGGRLRPGLGREPRRDRHSAASDHQSQRHFRRRPEAPRLLLAGRQARGASPRGAQGGDVRLAQILPWHRQRPAQPRGRRNRHADAPACSTPRSRSKAMPGCSTKRARSTGSRASHPNMARASIASR